MGKCALEGYAEKGQRKISASDNEKHSANHIRDLPEDAFRLIFSFSDAGRSLTVTNRHFYHMRRLLPLRLNKTYSRKFCDDENFRALVHSRLENPSKQLSLTLTTRSNYTGKGVYTWPDGEKYEGDFVDGKQHGKGMYTRPDGTIYEGDFVDGKQHGKVVCTRPDGTIYECDCVDGKQHGKAVCTLPDGAIYECDFVDGKQHGKGVYTLLDGSKFVSDIVL